MLRSLELIVTLALLLAPLAVQAQPAGKVWRIGYVTSQSAAAAGRVSFDAFRQGLRDLGYVEGQNISVEYRWADWKVDRVSALAATVTERRSAPTARASVEVCINPLKSRATEEALLH